MHGSVFLADLGCIIQYRDRQKDSKTHIYQSYCAADYLELYSVAYFKVATPDTGVIFFKVGQESHWSYQHNYVFLNLAIRTQSDPCRL